MLVEIERTLRLIVLFQLGSRPAAWLLTRTHCVTVLEAVQNLSRDVAGEARREKEERGCGPTLLKEEGSGIPRGREGEESLRVTDREQRKTSVTGCTSQ